MHFHAIDKAVIRQYNHTFKIVLAMQLTGILLLAACLQVSASAFGQKVTLTEHQASLKQVFKKIRKQTGYNFIYSHSAIRTAAPVTLQVKEASILEALNKALANQPLTYSIEDKIIIIHPKKEPAVPTSATLPDKEITGVVKDSTTGEPLAGVTVKVKDGSNGTVTDAKGKFTLTADNHATLVISYLGYKPKEITVNGENQLTITLASSTTGLNQLVVVGYGTQKKADLTGSISTINMEDKTGQPITNVSNALYGTPGLYVNLINSMPGTDRAQIRVRGIGNLNSTGSDPLVLVDGIEYPMNEINPNDIASISVLKDASAAIYGSKAANGVILVTTKKGRGEAKVNYSYYYGAQQPTFMPDAIWNPVEYMKLFDQAERNEGKQKVSFSDEQIHEYEVGMHVDPYTYPANNWFDKVLQNGNIQKHDISVSQSGKKFSYRASLGFLNRDGIFIGDGNKEKKYYFGLNSSLNLSKRLTVGFNLNGNYRTYTEPSTTMGTFLTAINRALPIMPDTLKNGDWAYTWLRVPGRNNWENPLMYLMNDGSDEKKQLWTVASVNASYKLPFDITYKVKFGVDKYDAFQERFYPKMIKYQVKTREEQVHSSSAPQSYNYDWNNMELHFYNTLNWNHDFKKGHNISAMVGASYDNYAVTNFNAQMQGYSDNTLPALSVGTDPYAISGNSKAYGLKTHRLFWVAKAI